MSVSEDGDVMTKGEPAYLVGYVPSSWDSQHSSLQRALTWLAMAMILLAISFAGVFVYGFATHDIGSQEHGLTIGIVGLVATVVFLLAGFFSVHLARAKYREYKKETGRVH